MNRRSFLQRAGATAATAAAVTALPMTAFAGVPVPPPIEPVRVHVLGMPVVDASQRFVKMMSDDVFERTLSALRGRSFQLTNGERVGEYSINAMWNNSIKVDSIYACEHPDRFDIEEFRRETNGWMLGCTMCPGGGGTPAAEAFGPRITQVGLPFLPVGLLWAAHYIDEGTGFAMRAVAQHEIYFDRLLARWDVLCG